MEASPKDKLLRLIVHTAFICSTRAGEVTGLTWDGIDFENEKIFIDKIIHRVDKKALQLLNPDVVLFRFPERINKRKRTIEVILKSAKTASSVRGVYITKQLCKELQEHKKEMELAKVRLGEDYHDYNLVFCQPTGDPITPNLLFDGLKNSRSPRQIMNKWCFTV